MNLRALALFIVLTGVMTLPLALDLTRHIPANAGDPAYTMWTMAWEAHALESAPDQFWNANIYYPEQGTLAYSTLNLSPMLVGLPVWLVTRNPILTYNLTFLFALFLIGYGTFLLSRSIGIGAWAGIIAGLIAEFSSFTFGQIDHLEILWFGWLPLLLVALGRLGQSGKIRNLISGVILFLMGSLATWYYALYLTYTAVGLGLYSFRRSALRRAVLVLAAIAVGWLAMMPLLAPYLPLGDGYTAKRPISTAEELALVPNSFLQVPYTNQTWRQLIGTYDGREGYLFPGVAFFILILFGIGPLWRSRVKRGRFLLLLGVVSLILGFGPSLQVEGKTVIALPERLLRLTPGFSLTRAPKRWASFATVAFAVVAGAGADRIGKKRTLAFLGLGSLILFENWSAPLPVATLPAQPDLEPLYQWLAAQPAQVVVELPMATEDRFAEQRIGYMYRSIFHWQREVNGVGDYVPNWYEPFVIASFSFPLKEAQIAFQSRKVQLVIVHGDQLQAEHLHWMLSEIEQGEGKGWLAPVARFGDTRVYRTLSP